jgi:patatin-like phospholipase
MSAERPAATGIDNVYPEELRRLEAAALAQRRRVALPEQRRGSEDQLPDDTQALALSGGGIRSATFNLGFLQALARSGVLRRIDLLSTVSGGGFVGGFVGRMFDRLRGAHQPVRRVEETLASTDSRPIRWLRRHGKYIAPEGVRDARLNVAIALRNFLTLHTVLLLYLFTAFGVIHLFDYAVLGTLTTVKSLALEEVPLGALSASLLGEYWTPWWSVAEVLLFVSLLPLAFAFWLVSADRPRAFQPAIFLVSMAALFLPYAVGLFGAQDLRPFALGLAVTISFLAAERAWLRADHLERAEGTGGGVVARQRPRQFVTMMLADRLVLLGVVLGLALADSGGELLGRYARGSPAQVFSAVGSALAFGLPMLRKLAGAVAGAGGSGSMSLLRVPLVRKLLVVPVALVPLIVASFLAHAAYANGDEVQRGVLATLGGLLLSVTLTSGAALPFVNRTSLAPTYATRLGRAYLGATNPERSGDASSSVDELAPGDDVASIEDYRPHEAGGPLHLINLCVNQTYDQQSSRGTRDRKGENMAVSSLGVTVGRDYHARWVCGAGRKRPKLAVMGRQPGRLNPFVALDRHPDGLRTDAEQGRNPERLQVEVERLGLQDWVALSGAAFAPGSGANTEPLTSLLTTLANVRLGRWWDSGLDAASRTGTARTGPLARLSSLLASELLTGQTLLLQEASARFGGPWQRYWYLSDGGFFENLGLYELARRRPGVVIACDAAHDPEYRLGDLADFVRKARIDFGAEVEPFGRAELERHVPAALVGAIGTLDELRQAGALRPCYATLLWIRYPAEGTRAATKSVLLYVKVGVNGSEPADVLGYRAQNPEFPQQSTADQFYDEGQWESYRRLGEHVGQRLFTADPSWLERIAAGARA